MKIRVLTHNHEEFIIDVENYNPATLVNELNEDQRFFVLIGDRIFSRVNIKEVGPVDSGI